MQMGVKQAHASTGYLLDGVDEPVCLLDPSCSGCPIVGASQGFVELTGIAKERLLGENLRVLLDGVPLTAISKGDQVNIDNFCKSCCLPGLSHISETTALRPMARTDGTTFTSILMLGLVVCKGQPFIVCVQRHVCEGLELSLNTDQLNNMKEASRQVLSRVRNTICGSSLELETIDTSFGGIFKRTGSQCMLLNAGETLQRREPTVLPTGCLAVGKVPMQRCNDGGLYFAARVNEVIPSFDGLPIFGFTCQKPVDSVDFLPSLSRFMGQSILVGACGEAFARDRQGNLKASFRPPAKEDLESWCLDKDKPSHMRKAPVSINVGDKVACLYTPSGRIQYWHNDRKVIDFDTGRPILPNTDYYAVVDVCFSVSSVTLLPDSVAVHEQHLCVIKNVFEVDTCDSLPGMVDMGSESDDEDDCLSDFSDEEEEEDIEGNSPASVAFSQWTKINGTPSQPSWLPQRHSATSVPLAGSFLSRSFLRRSERERAQTVWSKRSEPMAAWVPNA
jgi:hypothetical protein